MLEFCQANKLVGMQIPHMHSLQSAAGPAAAHHRLHPKHAPPPTPSDQMWRRDGITARPLVVKRTLPLARLALAGTLAPPLARPSHHMGSLDTKLGECSFRGTPYSPDSLLVVGRKVHQPGGRRGLKRYRRALIHVTTVSQATARRLTSSRRVLSVTSDVRYLAQACW